MRNKLISLMIVIFASILLSSCDESKNCCKKEIKESEKAKVVSVPSSNSSVEDANVIRILVENTNGSTTPVELRKVGSCYYGPKGEKYDTLPNRELLRSIYSW